jgi:hypothetical protein
MTNFAQLFCTVNDITADAGTPGVDEARMYQAIREASDYLQKEIGWFIPVTLTRNFKGVENATELFVPPLLSVTTLVNDTDTLTTSDYILKPDDGMWTNGPYTKIVADPDAPTLGTWSDVQDYINITGLWGLYNRSASITGTVADTTQQSDSQTTLKVSSGVSVSPGMLLLIGSEQELVTSWGDPTAAVTTTNASVSVTDDTITLTDASLVNVGEIIRIDYEQMKVKDRRTSANTIYVTRAWNGTARATHTSGANVDVYRTVNVERGVNGTTAAAHTNGASISRYFAPDDIQYLCKEIATLIVNKARSSYQGRTGSADTGIISYNDAFPKWDIDRIKARYELGRIG